MKGEVARAYAELVTKMWKGDAHQNVPQVIAPLNLKRTIAKFASHLMDGQQHDAQELMAFLLDGLHEDLNRIKDKPYVQYESGDGRSDRDIANEHWEVGTLEHSFSRITMALH